MKRILTLGSILIVLISTSCGAASAPTTDLNVTLTDFQFSPNSFTVPTGEEISLTAANTGAVLHNFIVMEQGYSVGSEFDEEDQSHVYWQVELSPGNSIETSFPAPVEPGEYEVVCSTAGHVQAGMLGTLNVVAAE
jgi:uncharacterized cupredoxin-like copper-binding protein